MPQTFNVGDIQAQITVDGSQLTIALGQANKEISGFAKAAKIGLSALTAPFRFLGRLVTGLVRGIFSLKGAVVGLLGGFSALKLAELASDVSALESSFKELTASVGIDAVTALEKVSAAANGTINQLDLMRQINNGILLGVADTTEEFELLAEAARRLGAATGRTATQGFADLNTGIGRSSFRVLDNLGIIVKANEAYRQFADRLGISTQELTLSQQRLAFQEAAFEAIRQKLAALGPDTETFANQFARLRANITNFAVTVARGVTPALSRLLTAFEDLSGGRGFASIFVDILTKIVDTMTRLVTRVGPQVLDFLRQLGEIFSRLATVVGIAFELAIDRFVQLISNPGEILEAIAEILGAVLDIFGELGADAGARFLEGFKGAISAETRAEVPAGLREFVREFRQLSEAEFQRATLGTGISLTGGGAIQARRDRLVEAQARRLSAVQREQVRRALESTDGTISAEERTALQSLLDEGNEKRANRFSRAFRRLRIGLVGDSKEIRATIKDLEEAFDDLLNPSRPTAAQQGSAFQPLIDGLARVQDLLERGRIIARLQEMANVPLGTLVDDSERLADAQSALAAFLAAQERGAFGGATGALGSLAAQLKARVDAAKIEREEREKLNAEAVKTLNGLQDETVALQAKLRVAEELRRIESEGGPAASERELRIREQVLGVLESTRGLQEQLQSQGLDEQARKLREETERRAEILERILRTEEETAANLRSQTERDNEKRQNAEQLADIIEGIRDDLREAEIDLDPDLDDLQRAKARIQQEFSNLRATIQSVELDDNARREFLADLAGLQRQASQQAVEDQKDAFKESVGNFTEELGRGIVSAIRRGEDPLQAIADTFIRQLENQLGQVFNQLGQSIGGLFFGQDGSLAKSVGGILGGLAGIGALIFSQQQRRGSEFTEAPIEEIATSTTAVRGVVAGPQSIAIAEVGASLREALRGVEALLGDILDVLQSSRGFATTGVGAAGAV